MCKPCGDASLPYQRFAEHKMDLACKAVKEALKAGEGAAGDQKQDEALRAIGNAKAARDWVALWARLRRVAPHRYEISLKEVFRLGVPPLEVEVRRVLGWVENEEDPDRGTWWDAKVLRIRPERIYSTTAGSSGQWLDTPDLNVDIPCLYIPIGNVTGMVRRDPPGAV